MHLYIITRTEAAIVYKEVWTMRIGVVKKVK